MSNLMNVLLRRKYIDIIYHESSQWANLDAPTPIVLKVGDYGDVDKGTGKFEVSGNINDLDFQEELDKLSLRLYLADHRPQEKEEDKFILTSKGAKPVDLEPEAGIANASLEGQWKFKQGKRDALLIMHRPRLLSLPKEVNLDTLYKAPKLKDKWLVTSVYLCPAFSMYLSSKSGETVSLALVAQVPAAGAAGVTAGAGGGLGWHHSDASADSLFRRECDEEGNYSYTPLYALKRRREGLLKRLFRAEEDPEDQTPEDDLWVDAPPPWDPLDDDGDIDSLAPTEEPGDPDVF